MASDAWRRIPWPFRALIKRGMLTNEQGAEITDPGWHLNRPIYIEDIAVTIYSAMGIDWTKKLTTTPSGRFFEYVEDISGTDFISPGEVSEFFA